MIPETASWSELLRLGMAVVGLVVGLLGVRQVRSVKFRPPPHLTPLRLRILREEWHSRMVFFMNLQLTVVGCHLLFLGNVWINLWYPSSPLEQPNVMSSNIMQIIVPALLIRASELVGARVTQTVQAFALDTVAVAGEELLP